MKLRRGMCDLIIREFAELEIRQISKLFGECFCGMRSSTTIANHRQRTEHSRRPPSHYKSLGIQVMFKSHRRMGGTFPRLLTDNLPTISILLQ